MNFFRKIIMSFIVLMLFASCISGGKIYGAVVGDNDGSALVTKNEFAIIKTSTDEKIINIVKSLNGSLSEVIPTVLANIVNGQEEIEAALNKIYPIGIVVIASSKPSFGTWEEVVAGMGGYCLWNCITYQFGKMLEQQMPIPSFTVEENKHTHKTTLGDMYTDVADNNHIHAQYYIESHGFGSKTAYKGTKYNFLTSDMNDISDHEPHSHKFHINAEMSSIPDHTHEINWLDDNPYKGAPGSKVQPNAYVVKMWKRTA